MGADVHSIRFLRGGRRQHPGSRPMASRLLPAALVLAVIAVLVAVVWHMGSEGRALRTLSGEHRRELLSHTVEELRRQLGETEAELAELDRRVAETPARQEELDGMVQREGVLRETYVGFLKKVQEAELAESLESAQHGERFSVIEKAEPPTEPARPRAKYLAAGVVAAFGLAWVAGIALELLDPVLVTRRQLEREVGMPVLGSVPRIS